MALAITRRDDEVERGTERVGLAMAEDARRCRIPENDAPRRVDNDDGVARRAGERSEINGQWLHFTGWGIRHAPILRFRARRLRVHRLGAKLSEQADTADDRLHRRRLGGGRRAAARARSRAPPRPAARARGPAG